MKVKQLLSMIIGACLYSIGINQLKLLNYGMGSFDSFTLDILALSPLDSFGNASFIIHFIFFVILALLRKVYKIEFRLIILSLVSIFILTRCVNILSVLPYYNNQSIIVLTLTFLIMNLGLFMLAKSNLIIAPFDKFLVETSNYLNISFGFIRLFADVIFLTTVIILNVIFDNIVPITIFTLIITLLTGPNIALYSWISDRIFSTRD